MTKSEFKKMLKPIVKECIQETLLEGGLLSGIIAEVVKGVVSSQVIVEQREVQPVQKAKQQRRAEIVEQQGHDEEQEYKYLEKLNETKKKMLDAIGNDSYNGVNLFENTEPMSSAPAPGASISPTSPLSTYGSKDAGVNIDGLFGAAGKNWNKLAKGNK